MVAVFLRHEIVVFKIFDFAAVYAEKLRRLAVTIVFVRSFCVELNVIVGCKLHSETESWQRIERVFDLHADFQAVLAHLVFCPERIQLRRARPVYRHRFVGENHVGLDKVCACALEELFAEQALHKGRKLR